MRENSPSSPLFSLPQTLPVLCWWLTICQLPSGRLNMNGSSLFGNPFPSYLNTPTCQWVSGMLMCAAAAKVGGAARRAGRAIRPLPTWLLKCRSPYQHPAPPTPSYDITMWEDSDDDDDMVLPRTPHMQPSAVLSSMRLRPCDTRLSLSPPLVGQGPSSTTN